MLKLSITDLRKGVIIPIFNIIQKYYNRENKSNMKERKSMKNSIIKIENKIENNYINRYNELKISKEIKTNFIDRNDLLIYKLSNIKKLKIRYNKILNDLKYENFILNEYSLNLLKIDNKNIREYQKYEELYEMKLIDIKRLQKELKNIKIDLYNKYQISI